MSEKEMSNLLPPSVNKRVGRAMHDYGMLSDGDRVLLAVSGGIDSLSLAWVLDHWRKKAPISYDLQAVTVDHEFWKGKKGTAGPDESIGQQMADLGIDYSVEKAWDLKGEERTCYQCARNRRSQLFDIARQRGFNKVALGHHKDDLIETFFLNVLYSGNISTMVPRQELFEGRLAIIRPLAYLEKEEVIKIGSAAGLVAVDNLCPLADLTNREKVRTILDAIYEQEPEAKKSIFSALSNVREGYLL